MRTNKKSVSPNVRQLFTASGRHPSGVKECPQSGTVDRGVQALSFLHGGAISNETCLLIPYLRFYIHRQLPKSPSEIVVPSDLELQSFIMGVVIYGASKATCTQRVLATLIEKGVTDYELKTVNMRAGEHKVVFFFSFFQRSTRDYAHDGPIELSNPST